MRSLLSSLSEVSQRPCVNNKQYLGSTIPSSYFFLPSFCCFGNDSKSRALGKKNRWKFSFACTEIPDMSKIIRQMGELAETTYIQSGRMLSSRASYSSTAILTNLLCGFHLERWRQISTEKNPVLENVNDVYTSVSACGK